MRSAPVTKIWIRELVNFARTLTGIPGEPYMDRLRELYARMSPEEQASDNGLTISAFLFPPRKVDVGDDLADGDLYDVDGHLHHLSDLTGKWILLDFWSVGCAPCLSSIPESDEVALEYSDILSVVRLSLDRKEVWKEAVRSKGLKCLEWIELKPIGTGLYAAYRVKGIPHFVLISPEGKVADVWLGYGPGSIKNKVKEHLKYSTFASN